MTLVRRLRGLALVVLATAPALMAGRASADPARPVVYAVGDSIAAGALLAYPAMQAWPERLDNRVYGPDRSRARTVAHGGGCLVATICAYGPPLVDTWQAEILGATPTPTTVVLEIGRNDLAHATDEQMLAAYHQLVAVSATRGVRVIVMTVLPAGGGYQWSAWTEPQRARVNARIRAEFADVADAAAATTVGAGDGQLDPYYDSGDHVHPDWAGHVVMADAVPLGAIT